jgi:DNA anti-recombination protein RmuC
MIVSICLANLALACLIGFVIYVALKNSRSTAEAQLMRAEFEIMAKRVFEAETQRFRQTSEAGIERVLEPIQQRLRDFEKKVDDVYQSEGRERHVL